MKYRKGETGELRGMYDTSFFEMYVRIPDENVDLTKLSNDSLSCFFHEYIHFLQDISTFSGINGLYCYSEYIKGAINAVKKLKKINLPIIVPFSKNNVKLNGWLYEHVYRRSSVEDVILCGFLAESKISVPARYQKDIRNLTIYDIHACNKIVPFGTLAISESMAYLAEQLCLPDSYTTSPDYPYSSAKFVASKYSKSIAEDNLMLFALCDCSLMHSNPPQFFVETLKRVKNGNLKIVQPEDVYGYLYDMRLPNQETFKVSFEKHLEMTRQCVHDYLKDLPEAKVAVFEKYNECVDNYFNMARELRLDYPTMLLDMMKQGCMLKNKIFNYVYQKIGTPLLRTDGGYSNYQPNKKEDEIGIEWFKAVKQVMDALYKGTSICEMCDMCSTYDEDCINYPWMHTEQDDKLCMYNFVWKHWGLARHIIGNVTYKAE